MGLTSMQKAKLQRHILKWKHFPLREHIFLTFIFSKFTLKAHSMAHIVCVKICSPGEEAIKNRRTWSLNFHLFFLWENCAVQFRFSEFPENPEVVQVSIFLKNTSSPEMLANITSVAEHTEDRAVCSNQREKLPEMFQWITKND